MEKRIWSNIVIPDCPYQLVCKFSSVSYFVCLEECSSSVLSLCRSFIPRNGINLIVNLAQLVILFEWKNAALVFYPSAEDSFQGMVSI
jgi:hypothetical protein